MMLFFHAARLALVVFDPYLASRPLGRSAQSRAARQADSRRSVLHIFLGRVLCGGVSRPARAAAERPRQQSRIWFLCSGRSAGRVHRRCRIPRSWLSPDLYYICVEKPQVERLERLVGREALHPVIESGGKFVFRNRDDASEAMRITIDATSALLRSAGVKSYTYHWLRHLRQQAAPATRSARFRCSRTWDRAGSRTSALPLAPTIVAPGLAARRERSRASALDLLLRGTDVFHASNLVRQRAAAGAPHRDHPRSDRPGSCRKFTRQSTFAPTGHFAERILKRADGLIAVSENTRQDAIRLLGIAPEANPHHPFRRRRRIFRRDARRARAKPYVLFVGTIEPRKNLDTLLDAWRR